MTHPDRAINPLVISVGEPAGIGPDLILQIVAEGLTEPLVAIVSKSLLAQRAQHLNLDVTLIDYTECLDWSGVSATSLVVQDVQLPAPCVAGQLDVANAAYVLQCLDLAIDGCLSGQFSGLVTGPLHKGIINDAGVAFTGHTEHLQMRCDVDKVVMMLASPRMRVALASTHLPLKDVAGYITRDNLRRVMAILIADLQSKFGLAKPRIIVAGLNPHAGENGHMGREEIDIIQPVMAEFEYAQVDLLGPLPADTLFNKKYLEQADAVLAMYHDQGLPVLKFDGFGESVNITLGLPIIRTSVDHGTALDLAGKGVADSGSFKTAIRLAADMARSSKR